jgi:transmembrane sensor
VELQKGEAMFEVAKNQARPFVVSAGGVDVRAVGTAFAVQLGREAVDVLVTEGTVAVGHSNQIGRHGNVAKTDPSAPRVATAPTGALATAASAADSPLAGVLVRAGNRAVVERTPTATAARVAPVEVPEMGERLAWRNPRVEFSGTRLDEAIALLNRVAAANAGMQLSIADPALESMRVSGIFRTDNVDAFVLLLEAGFGVKVERAGKTLVLRKVATVGN